MLLWGEEQLRPQVAATVAEMEPRFFYALVFVWLFCWLFWLLGCWLMGNFGDLVGWLVCQLAGRAWLVFKRVFGFFLNV